jgi:hypothetical protein
MSPIAYGRLVAIQRMFTDLDILRRMQGYTLNL